MRFLFLHILFYRCIVIRRAWNTHTKVRRGIYLFQGSYGLHHSLHVCVDPNVGNTAISGGYYLHGICILLCIAV